jgi:hypothetical protein
LFFHYLLDRPVVCNQRSYFVLQDVCCTMHPIAFADTLIDLLKTIYSTKINCVSEVFYWRDGCTNWRDGCLVGLHLAIMILL